jgi:hypothetical protein
MRGQNAILAHQHGVSFLVSYEIALGQVTALWHPDTLFNNEQAWQHSVDAAC